EGEWNVGAAFGQTDVELVRPVFREPVHELGRAEHLGRDRRLAGSHGGFLHQVRTVRIVSPEAGAAPIGYNTEGTNSGTTPLPGAPGSAPGLSTPGAR